MAAFLAMAGAQVIGGLIGAATSAYQARQSQKQADIFQRKLDEELANRPDIPDLAESITDRSGMIQNQMANLQVATQAAEFQAEEADLALANTLATARQTGLGAGGATALAQAALRSKRGISASIEQQEARNVLLRAQGAATAEERRLSEGARVDRGQMLADQFSFQAQEARSQQAIERASNLLDAQNYQTQMNRQAMYSSLGSALGAAGGTLGAAKLNQGKGETFKNSLIALGA